MVQNHVSNLFKRITNHFGYLDADSLPVQAFIVKKIVKNLICFIVEILSFLSHLNVLFIIVNEILY